MFYLFFFLLTTTYCQKFAAATSPTWIKNDNFVSGCHQVITTLTGNDTITNYPFIFPVAMKSTPSIVCGIQKYRGEDSLQYQYFEILLAQIKPTGATFTLEIYGMTNINIFSICYLAIQAAFPHHLNTFLQVPLNYSSGNLVKIKIFRSMSPTYRIRVNLSRKLSAIASKQAEGRTYKTFTGAIKDYKIVLFLTSLSIQGTVGGGRDLYHIKLHINPLVLNSTHYSLTLTLQIRVKIIRIQFSQIIFNQKDVESSRKYYIVHQQLITDLDGGLIEIPAQFAQNFIMALTDFQTQSAQCNFQYQWQISPDPIGYRVLRSQTDKSTCGFSWMRTSIFYIKTWQCTSPNLYFNLSTNLCESTCNAAFIQNSIDSTCDCQSGYFIDDNTCTQTCGDGILFSLECDDGNLIIGDGCDSQCKIETGYSCTGGDSTSKTSCVLLPTNSSITNQTVITLLSFSKIQNQNDLEILLTVANISPAVAANISQYVLVSFSYESFSSRINPQTLIITLNLRYNQSLNGLQPLLLTISNAQNMPSYYQLPDTTDTNLALKKYDQSIYQMCSNLHKFLKVFSFIVFATFLVLFLFVSRVIAVEMIFVFQFTYCGMVMLRKLQCLMKPFELFWISNSYNGLNNTVSNVYLPPRLKAISYKAQFFYNFNLDFIIFWLPMLIGIILYLSSNLKQSKRLRELGSSAIKEWQLSAMLFCEFQLSYALVICIKYEQQKSQGIIIGLLLIFFLLFWSFKNRNSRIGLGQYKQRFKKDSFSQIFYLIIVLYRIILSFTMICFADSIVSPIFTFILCLSWVIILIGTTPYHHNFLPISNSLVILAISTLYLYNRSVSDLKDLNFATYCPIIILILLIYTYLATIIFSIYSYRIQKRLAKVNNEIQNIHNENTQEIRLQSRLEINETIKEPKESIQQNIGESILFQNKNSTIQSLRATKSFKLQSLRRVSLPLVISNIQQQDNEPSNH